MKNISLQIEKFSYGGEFYFKATLDMAIYRSAVTTYQLYKDFSAKIVSVQILTVTFNLL